MPPTPFPIHIDANIPIYAAGRPHRLKAPCQEVIRMVSRFPQAFATNAEVLHELLHFYLAGQNWPPGQAVFRAFATVMVDRIEPVLAVDVSHAATLAGAYTRLSARDLLHVAVMQRTNSTHIVSADHDFDSVPGVQRLDPAQVDLWRQPLGL
jgi:uncharacterized protein